MLMVCTFFMEYHWVQLTYITDTMLQHNICLDLCVIGIQYALRWPKETNVSGCLFRPYLKCWHVPSWRQGASSEPIEKCFIQFWKLVTLQISLERDQNGPAILAPRASINYRLYYRNLLDRAPIPHRMFCATMWFSQRAHQTAELHGAKKSTFFTCFVPYYDTGPTPDRISFVDMDMDLFWEFRIQRFFCPQQSI